ASAEQHPSRRIEQSYRSAVVLPRAQGSQAGRAQGRWSRSVGPGRRTAAKRIEEPAYPAPYHPDSALAPHRNAAKRSSLIGMGTNGPLGQEAPGRARKDIERDGADNSHKPRVGADSDGPLRMVR